MNDTLVTESTGTTNGINTYFTEALQKLLLSLMLEIQPIYKIIGPYLY